MSRRHGHFMFGFVMGFFTTVMIIVWLILFGCSQTIIVGDGHVDKDGKHPTNVESTEAKVGASIKITKENP